MFLAFVGTLLVNYAKSTQVKDFRIGEIQEKSINDDYYKTMEASSLCKCEYNIFMSSK